MKLFAIYVGGEMLGANIELHDMRFVVAPSITETYDELQRQWWGIPKSLHIDCWAEISHADSYDITLSAEPFVGPERLYYVNLGGYAEGEFSEQHKNVFVVADTVTKAKARALKVTKNWREPHRDEMYEAEQAFSLSDAGRAQQLFIHLTPNAEPRELTFTCDYMPIRK
ncbi:MAG TPA: DUF1543 domain-containing protein [Afipia sp.]